MLADLSIVFSTLKYLQIHIRKSYMYCIHIGPTTRLQQPHTGARSSLNQILLISVDRGG